MLTKNKNTTSNRKKFSDSISFKVLIFVGGAIVSYSVFYLGLKAREANLTIDENSVPYYIKNDPSKSVPDLIVQSLNVTNRDKRIAAFNCNASISFNNINEMEDLEDEVGSIFLDFFGEIKERAKQENNVVIDTPRVCLSKYYFRKVKNELLCWSFLGNPPYINLNPQNSKYLDFYVFDTKDSLIYLPTESGWKVLRMILKAGEKSYSGTITISSENANIIKRNFIINRAGTLIISTSNKQNIWKRFTEKV